MPVRKRRKRPTWRWIPRRRFIPLDDEFFEDGDIACAIARKKLSLPQSKDLLLSISRFEEFPCHSGNCTAVFETLLSYEQHYHSAHRHTCMECHRVFPSLHLLDLHLSEWHDSVFQILASKQNMYQCLIESCEDVFPTTSARKSHLIEQHKYPSNFRFDRPHKNRKKKATGKLKDVGRSEDMEVSILTQEIPITSGSTSPPDNCNMEIDVETKETKQQHRKYVCNVPKNLCFGRGVQRGFQRPPRGRHKKHWHQQAKRHDTSVNIENVNMNALHEALN